MLNFLVLFCFLYYRLRYGENETINVTPLYTEVAALAEAGAYFHQHMTYRVYVVKNYIFSNLHLYV